MPKVVKRRNVTPKLTNESILVENHVEFEEGAVTTQNALNTPRVALIVPVTRNGDLVFVRQFRHAVNDYVVEFPAGKIKKHELPDVCARRELQEETSYKATNLSLLTSVYASPEFTNELIHVYLAAELSRSKGRLGRYERLTVVHMSVAETMKFFAPKQAIRDAKTMAALLIYLTHPLSQCPSPDDTVGPGIRKLLQGSSKNG